MTPEASPMPDSRQFSEEGPEDEAAIDALKHELAEEELRVDGDGPTHHPTAPPHELFDMSTTVDPSYIISLIRKLLPLDGGESGEFQGLPTSNDSSQRSQPTKMEGTTSSPILNNSNGNIEAMETQHCDIELSPSSAGIDGQASPNNCKKSAVEDAWEESGCILWDLAANKEHAEFMVQNLVLEVLLANLVTSDSVRIKEIGLGIIGNLACHGVLMDQITTTNGLLEAIVDQLYSDDAPCLCELFRLLTLGLQGCQCVVWAKALQSEQILSRVLWIAENTLNPILIERSAAFLLAIMEKEQEVAAILLPILVNLGMPSLLVNLLAFEMGKLTSERLPERYPALDAILRAIEALSVIDDYSKEICSNKELFLMAIDLVKVPEKIEISGSCVTAAVLIANVLADATDLALEMSDDIVFLQSLLDLFPFTSDDFEARNALWSILARLLFQVPDTEMSPLRLSQVVQTLTSRSDLIEDVLLDGEEGAFSEKHEMLTTSGAKMNSRTIAIKRIISILNQWNVVRNDSSVEQNGNPLETNHADDRGIQKLLHCCLKHAS